MKRKMPMPLDDSDVFIEIWTGTRGEIAGTLQDVKLQETLINFPIPRKGEQFAGMNSDEEDYSGKVKWVAYNSAERKIKVYIKVSK